MSAYWRGATLLCITHDVGETLSFERAGVCVLREGDLCLVLGAGDVDALGRRLVT